MTVYSGSKSPSTSTPSLFLGRSRTCPMEAMTLKSRPKYLLIVFAFAGDSTMTSALAIPSTNSRIVNSDKTCAWNTQNSAVQFQLAQFRQQDGRFQATASGQLLYRQRLPLGHYCF